MSINVVYNCSNEYAYITAVSIVSILKNSKPEEEFKFIILHKDIPEYKQKLILELRKIKECNIEFLKVDPELFREYTELIKGDGYEFSNYRLKLASSLPQFNRALFLDSDTLVLDSLSELWNMDIESSYIACVVNPDVKLQYEYTIKDKEKFPDRCFNTGMILANLKKWREDNLEAKIKDAFVWYTSKYSRWPDQQALNIACKDKILELDASYNLGVLAYRNDLYDDNSVYEKAVRHPVIIHYFGGFERPWLCPGVEFGAEWWSYARLTPFYEALLTYACDYKGLFLIKDLCAKIQLYTKKDYYIFNYGLFKLLNNLPINNFKKRFKKYEDKYRIIESLMMNENHCNNYKHFY